MKTALFCVVTLLAFGFQFACANVPGGIITTSSNVTLTDNGTTVTIANGILSIIVTKADASIHTINYTYNNGAKTVTNPLLAGGQAGAGGMLYWTGNPASFGTMNFTYSLVANTGTYAEISLLSTSATNGNMEIHYSMLKGSPGFYCTPILTHRGIDGPVGIVMRPNIYAGAQFNWMSVDAARNRIMEVAANATTLAVPTGPKECYLWTNGIYQGRYEDKYKYSADIAQTPAWGWSSVGTSGSNVGIWNITASPEYYPAGPMERSLMEHIGTTILNVFTGGYYGLGGDNVIQTGELWSKTYGPYFYYVNNIASSNTNSVVASQALYADALAQAAAEKTAWPYTWFNNSNYIQATGRGTVNGTMVISDTGNPNASAANLWVGVVQQPSPAYDTVYDFQAWTRPYQYWARTDANGNFSIPFVISGSDYTLYAFGPGGLGTNMSQAQTGGTSPLIYSIPASPFSVTVTGGTTTNVGTVTWTPNRAAPTVFEIGYPDRTAAKFRHGDDYWVGDIGPNINSPSSVWTKFLEFPFDFPSGSPNYVVGTGRWSTDWNFIQPVELSTAGGWNNTSSNITFNLPAGTSTTGTASLYLGLCSDYYAAMIVTVNGHNLSSAAGLKAYPNTSIPSTGYLVGYASADTSIREGNNGAFSDERISFNASILNTGNTPNTINLAIRQVGGTYFADHLMYDYLRLELTGYSPPPPASVTAYPGNNSVQLSWPVTPGATTYNVLRSTTSGSGYSSLATGVVGPVCGSGPSNATYVDATATNGATYYYVIQSVNPINASANSTQSAGVTPTSAGPTSAPSAPAGLTVTSTNSAATLNWSAAAGANYYTVLRSTMVANGGGTNFTLSTITLSNTVTGLTYTDTTPTNGSTYSYTVLASNALGSSATATPATATPEPPAPANPPATVTAVPGAEQVTVNWSAVTGATAYVLEYSITSGGPYTFLASIDYLTYTDTGKADNSRYYYVVYAVNSGGASASSVEVSATTAPAAPTGLATRAGNTQATLSWNASTAATSYSVQRSTVTGGPYTAIGTSAGTTFTDTALANGTTYYYVVAASNANGTGLNSTEVNTTPVTTVPIAPTGLTATPGNAQVALNWTASAGATAYTVYRGATTGGPYTTVASGLTATTYDNTALTNGATYYFVVAAASASGTGANSKEASATPSSVPVNLTWTGSASAAWDTATANWAASGGSAYYVDPASVTFNDTSTRNAVTITGTVSPNSVNFIDSTANYSLSGGIIAGSGALSKSGATTLTLNNVNTYTGGTLLTGGTLALGVTGATGASAGTGAVSLGQGATFQMADSGGHDVVSNPVQLTAAASATFASASLLNTFTGPVSGPSGATLTLSGPLSAAVSGSAQFAGFSGLVLIPAGSQLDFYAASPGANGNGSAATSFQIDGVLNSRNASGANGILLGSLSGSGSLQGQSDAPRGNDIYIVGGNNLDSTFSGSVVDGSNGTASIYKVGAGTLTLSGSSAYNGATSVNGGTLKITGTVAETSSLTTAPGATLYLAGGSLSILGPVNNAGTFKISGTPTLSFSGAFTNNGVLDLINGPSTLPPDFVNNGVVIDASTARVQQVAVTGSNITISIQGYAGHNYQFQSSRTMAAETWQNLGPVQPGANSTLIFTGTGGASSPPTFYRIQVSP